MWKGNQRPSELSIPPHHIVEKPSGRIPFSPLSFPFDITSWFWPKTSTKSLHAKICLLVHFSFLARQFSLERVAYMLGPQEWSVHSSLSLKHCRFSPFWRVGLRSVLPTWQSLGWVVYGGKHGMATKNWADYVWRMSYKCRWNPKLPECKTTILKIFFLENVSNENRTDHCCRVPGYPNWRIPRAWREGLSFFTEAFSGSQIRWNKPLEFRWVDDPSPPLKCILGWWTIPYWWPIPDTTNEWWTVLLATLQMDRSDVKLKLFTVYSTSKPLHLPTESHGFIHYFQGTLELLRGSSLSMLSERPPAEIWAVQNKFQLQQCQVSWEYHLDTC